MVTEALTSLQRFEFIFQKPNDLTVANIILAFKQIFHWVKERLEPKIAKARQKAIKNQNSGKRTVSLFVDRLIRYKKDQT